MSTPAPKKQRKTVIIAIVFLLVITVLIAYRLVENKKAIVKSQEVKIEIIDAIPVKIDTVVLKMVDTKQSFSGAFQAYKILPIVAEAQGLITKFSIKDGDWIGKNQLVANIDATALLANLQAAKIQLDKTIIDAERFERLAKMGAVSKKQAEDVALLTASAKANYTIIQQQIKHCSVLSPMQGIVSEVKVEPGSFVQVGNLLARVIDASKLKMVIDVAETEVVKVRKGQSVEIIADIYPEHTFKGNISLIATQPNEARNYAVEVELTNNPTYPLKPGMFGKVLIDLKSAISNKPQLHISRKALVGSIKSPQVFVLKEDNSVVLKNIEVIGENEEEIIISNGLNASEKVVISGQINLVDGKKVSVLP